ncbi:MAG: putative Fe-S cluster assembly protein SufT [Thermoanaerobaculia bacterium]|nr:putative Fe-S cluster assembly protein SufT [Thermoanaerobaculia bacterium]
MHTREETTLSRDVQAVQIPDGTPTLLPEGSLVLITQQLGGTYTVMTDRGGMYRIDETGADALGKTPEAPPEAAVEETAGGSLDDRVWDQLRKCYDPEIPVNIVDLGLVYDCSIEGTEGDARTVKIKMTLTAPGCGMGPVLADDVKRRVESLDEVAEAQVEVVLDPPWNPGMMTEAARLQLGFM